MVLATRRRSTRRRGRVGHARVVDQHVELDDRFDDRRYRVGVVEIHRPRGGPELARRPRRAGRRPSREEQRVGRRERVGDGRAEPPRRPGDHRRRHVVTLPTCKSCPAVASLRRWHHDPSFAPTQLAARAAYLLRGNDLGMMTTAAPLLYPHMWSWDAAFVAIGLAPLSVERAVVELDTLLSAQWANGMIPHIVFANGVDGYFPGPARWATLGAGRQRAAQPAHVGHHPAAGARDRGAAHPRPRPQPRAVHPRGRRGVPRPPVGRPGAVAPLAGRSPRPEVARPRHAVPRLGVRHGQLAAVGQRVRQRGARPRARIPARGQRDRHRRQPAAVGHRIRPLSVAARGDEVGPLRRRAAAQGDELRRRGRVRVGDPRRWRATCSPRSARTTSARTPTCATCTRGPSGSARASSRPPTNATVRQGITTCGPRSGWPPRRSRSSPRCCAAGCRTTRSARCCGCWRGHDSAGIRT